MDPAPRPQPNARLDNDSPSEIQPALLEAEERLRALFEYAAEAIVMLDVETLQFIDANPMAERLFGIPRKNLLEVGPFELSPRFQPNGSSSELGKQKIQEANSDKTLSFEWWHCNAMGERFPCEVRLVRMPWGNREVLRGTIVDVSDRKLLELSELGRRRILENISRGSFQSGTLASLVSTVEELLPGMKCSVLLLDHETNQLRIGAAPSLPDFYNQAVNGLKIGPAVGSCGEAAFTGKRVIVSNVATHDNWAAFRMIAEQAKIKACWSEPIVSLSGRVLGTFAMYYAVPSEPAPVELRAIEVAAQIGAEVIEHEIAKQSQQEISNALERRLTEESKNLPQATQEASRAEQDALLSAVSFDTYDSIVITDLNGKIVRINASFTKLTGYSPEDVIGKTPHFLKSDRHDESFYRDMWRAIGVKGCWEGEIWNKRKDGHVFLQWLTISCVKNALGETTHYVGDGHDVTQQKRSEADRNAIKTACAVQLSLLPTDAPSVPGFEIAGSVQVADRASGDFFDYIPLNENSIGILVADVSGHGLGSALLMAQVQGYMRALSEDRDDPAKIIDHANRLFWSDSGEHFVTLFLACLNVERRSLIYASAGHQGYMFRATGETEVLESTGLPIGVVENSSVLLAKEIIMRVGDIVLLPTDGIEETCSRDDKPFGRKRLYDTIRNNAKKSAFVIVESLFCEARNFAEGAPQEDDMTAVVVKALST